MDEKNLDKIFDRFFQIKTAETARLIGSGIGLSFSKKIVELHHGEIKAKSQKNKGTEFIVKLSMDTNLYQGQHHLLWRRNPMEQPTQHVSHVQYDDQHADHIFPEESRGE